MPVGVSYPPPIPTAPGTLTATAAGTVTAHKAVRTGTVGLAVEDTLKTVTFAAMPNTAYSVVLELATGIPASFGVDTKTVTSFRMLSVGTAISAFWSVREL